MKSRATRKILPARSGFTLVEMMMVVLLIGIVAAVATPPMFRYLQTNRLQTNADQLAADLQFARSLSIANGQILQFTTTAGGYTLTDPSDGTVFRDRDFHDGLKLASDQTTFFFPWGMADATTLTLNGSSQSRQINVLPTGMVEVVHP